MQYLFTLLSLPLFLTLKKDFRLRPSKSGERSMWANLVQNLCRSGLHVARMEWTCSLLDWWRGKRQLVLSCFGSSFFFHVYPFSFILNLPLACLRRARCSPWPRCRSDFWFPISRKTFSFFFPPPTPSPQECWVDDWPTVSPPLSLSFCFIEEDFGCLFSHGGQIPAPFFENSFCWRYYFIFF